MALGLGPGAACRYNDGITYGTLHQKHAHRQHAMGLNSSFQCPKHPIDTYSPPPRVVDSSLPRPRRLHTQPSTSRIDRSADDPLLNSFNSSNILIDFTSLTRPLLAAPDGTPAACARGRASFSNRHRAVARAADTAAAAARGRAFSFPLPFPSSPAAAAAARRRAFPRSSAAAGPVYLEHVGAAVQGVVLEAAYADDVLAPDTVSGISTS